MAPFSSTGRHIRLEPLSRLHVDGLVLAAAADRSLYEWSAVPQNRVETERYVDTAIAWAEAGTALPLAIVRRKDNLVIGSTRFWNLEQWAWPEDRPRHGSAFPDVCEIGYAWLSAAAIRTAANTEAKFLMLKYAFDSWGVLRVCFHTDARNARSRAALERIGATYEGVLRAHRLAADYTPRDSARFSILAAEWPAVRLRLSGLMGR